MPVFPWRFKIVSAAYVYGIPPYLIFYFQFLLKSLLNLSQGISSLDASRPWLVYWILHSLELLSVDIPAELRMQVVAFLAKCQHAQGGFGGGPGQLAHLAPTYAAVQV